MKEKYNSKGIFVLCGIYLMVSFVLFGVLFGFNAVIGEDSGSYMMPAKNLLSKGFFSGDGVTPEYRRTPGYPLFLASVYLFGGSNTTVVIIQILLMTLRIYLFHHILLILATPRRLALLGTAFVLIDVQSYGYSFSILTQPLFGLFTIFALFFLVKYLYQGKNNVFFLLFSLSLNYALLIRPVLMYFNMLLCIALLIFTIFRKITVQCLAMFILSFILLFGGWSYRNYVHSSVFIFSTINNENMLLYYSPIITAHMKNMQFNPRSNNIEGATDYHAEKFLEEYPEAKGDTLNEPQKSILHRRYGLDFIKNHFSAYLFLNLKGLMTMMFIPFQTGVLQRSSSLSGRFLIIRLVQSCLFVYLCLVYLVYIAGLIKNSKSRKAVHISIFLISGYFAAASAIFAAPVYRDQFFMLILLSAVNNSGTLIRSLCEKTRIPSIKRVGEYLLESNTDLCRKDVNI